jgi:hypothetical protein
MFLARHILHTVPPWIEKYSNDVIRASDQGDPNRAICGTQSKARGQPPIPRAQKAIESRMAICANIGILRAIGHGGQSDQLSIEIVRLSISSTYDYSEDQM